MGRWSQYDEDDYRLPEGMKRVGYDSDSGRYYFRDKDGSLWQGSEGVEFGEMTKVNDASVVIVEDGDDSDLESAPSRADGYQPVAPAAGESAWRPSPNTNAYRTLFPFFLIICVVLLLIWRLVLLPHSSSAPGTITCTEDSVPYWIQSGDTCWRISTDHGCTLDAFRNKNPSIDCAELVPGRKVCLPV